MQTHRKQVSKPLHVGLKVARTAVWAAALTLAAVKVKRLCHEAADAACTAARARWAVRQSIRFSPSHRSPD